MPRQLSLISTRAPVTGLPVDWRGRLPSSTRVVRRPEKPQEFYTPEVAADANAKFLAAMQSQEARERIAAGAASYIKQRLREESFARKVMQPVVVSHVEVHA